MECGICKLLNKENEEGIYETEHWKVALSPYQTYPGRCYVTLKRHAGDLAELEKEEVLDFSELVKKLETALKKAFGATMFNWTCLMNDAYQEKIPKPHLHWHFRPRYSDKVEIAGLIFEDKEFGHNYSRDRERSQEVSEDVRKKIIKEIRKNL